jgi:anaerobic dimethyl sulfoxide reductase subunit B (iron-sulfur subunit)
MAKQMAFYFDSTVCTGCKACVIACKDRSDLPVGVNWRRVYLYESGSWIRNGNNKDLLVPSNFSVYSLSVACMHCEKPLCVDCCPTGALEKRDDGIVLIDEDKCIGCRYCEWACPYEGPQFNEDTGKMTKCDFCASRLDQGLNPVCVDACPMRVLDFGDMDELRAKYGNVREVAPLPSADITGPCMIVSPHRHAQPSAAGMGKISSIMEVKT